MPRSFRIFIAVVALAAAFSVALPLLAAPAAWQSVDITQHSEQSGGVLLVSGELPESTPLPAEAELAVPANSELQWIGEILGGDASQDPAVQYTKTTADGVDVYRFTLTKSRTAQIEVPLSAGQTFDGSVYTSALSWRATQDTPEVNLHLRVPQSAKVTQPVEGASMIPGDSGYSFYSKTIQDVKAGDQLALSVGYTLPAVTASSGAPQAAASNSLVPMVLVLVVLAAGAVMVVAVRRKMAVRNGDADAGEQTAGAQSEVVQTVTEASDEQSESGASPQLSGKAKRNLVTALIIGGLVVVALIVGAQSTRPKATGDIISQTFAPGEACATTTIVVAGADTGDPSATANALFEALKPVSGLNSASYNVKTSSLDVGYCESKTTEAVIRQALAPTGMLAAGGTTALPAQ